MTRAISISLIGGDGIGPEVTDAALSVIDSALHHEVTPVDITWNRLPFGAEHYLKTGETLPDEAFQSLRDDADAIFLGALGDPRVPGNEHARDILLGLRFRLDLFINFRPCTLLDPTLCPLRNRPDGRSWEIDMTIFRENTEGSYLGRGSSKNEGTDQEEQIVEEVHTAPKVNRLLRAAFDWAQAHGKKRVTVSDKSNAIAGHRLWRRLATQIAAEYTGIELEFYYVDALAMEMVRAPDRFDVIATNNLFGDILSDLGSQLVGGLGVAASANLHPGRPGLFEPVHGSAPPLVGTGQANPLAAVATGALMLDHLGLLRAAAATRGAVAASIRAGVATPDLGGTASTGDVTKFLCQAVS